MKKILQKFCSLVLAAVLTCSMVPASAEASFEIPGICQVQADSGTSYTVKTLDYYYENNTYLSLRDMAMVLKDTDKAFSLEVTRNAVALNKGQT